MERASLSVSCGPFDPSAASDPQMARVVSDICEMVADRGWYYAHDQVEEIGRELLRKDTSWNRRGVRALLEQARYWQGELIQIKQESPQVASAPDDQTISYRLCIIWEIVSRLCRRRLSLSEDDLIYLIDTAAQAVPWFGIDSAAAVKQAEFSAADGDLSRNVTRALADLRRASEIARSKEWNKLRVRIDHLIADAQVEPEKDETPIPPGEVPMPTWAGRPDVLVDLKTRLGLMAPAEGVQRKVIGPNRFPLRADSPLIERHEMLSEFFEENLGGRGYSSPTLGGTLVGDQILSLDPSLRGELFLAACERAAAAYGAPTNYDEPACWQSRYTAAAMPALLCETPIELNRGTSFDSLLLATAIGIESGHIMIGEIKRIAAEGSLSEGERHLLHRLRCAGLNAPPLGVCPDWVNEISNLLGEPGGYWLVPGEHWSDLLHSHVAKLPTADRAAWFGLIKHAATANSSNPSARWTKTAADLLKPIGPEKLARHVDDWFAAVGKGRSIRILGRYVHDARGGGDTINDGNATVLKGLVWVLALAQSRDSPRAIADLLIACLKKMPGVGPRAVKVANACVWALGKMAASDDLAVRTSALGQLAKLKARVTFRTTLKAIDKALDAAAMQVGMSREELEEAAVPAYGMEEVGIRREALGDYTAEVVVTGTASTEWRWFRPNAKPQKSAPKPVRDQYADDFKELKQAAKDIERMLPAQRDRIDKLFLEQRAWPYSVWRERYLDHPLVGTLARRIIWRFTTGRETRDGLWFGGRLIGRDDVALDNLDDTTRVSLWHPIDHEPDEIAAWRTWLDQHQVRQPMKQAHREVYLLTDAERGTRTYSNRFAAHIIKQHQFNALCAIRGWKNKLRLLVDDTYPPAHRDLDRWAPEPLALDQVPPLVFSEIMRDVDLFVGVASVGNDPAWADGGPEGRHVDYWQRYSFGDLEESANTRRAVLETLVPRLKIAERCSLNDKFLIVRGDVRTYKIHLGSSNILMEPNDQYLCIVPGRSVRKPGGSGDGKMFLPFEGDDRLAVILSKAFMLAEDAKITDPTILSQIGR